VNNNKVFDYLLTYLLTPWSRVLLEKLTGFQLVKINLVVSHPIRRGPGVLMNVSVREHRALNNQAF